MVGQVEEGVISREVLRTTTFWHLVTANVVFHPPDCRIQLFLRGFLALLPVYMQQNEFVFKLAEEDSE